MKLFPAFLPFDACAYLGSSAGKSSRKSKNKKKRGIFYTEV
jgi:hypothetical protein